MVSIFFSFSFFTFHSLFAFSSTKNLGFELRTVPGAATYNKTTEYRLQTQWAIV